MPGKSLWTAHSGGILVGEPTRLTGRGKAALGRRLPFPGSAERAGPSLGFQAQLKGQAANH